MFSRIHHEQTILGNIQLVSSVAAVKSLLTDRWATGLWSHRRNFYPQFV